MPQASRLGELGMLTNSYSNWMSCKYNSGQHSNLCSSGFCGGSQFVANLARNFGMKYFHQLWEKPWGLDRNTSLNKQTLRETATGMPVQGTSQLARLISTKNELKSLNFKRHLRVQNDGLLARNISATIFKQGGRRASSSPVEELELLLPAQ